MNHLVAGAFVRSSRCCCSVGLERSCYRAFTTTHTTYDGSSADMAASSGADAALGGAAVVDGTEAAATNIKIFGDLVKEESLYKDTVMNSFNWITDRLPSFSGSSTPQLWYDSVEPSLAHLYIPSVYEAIQNYTGVSYFVVVVCGSLTLRTVLHFTLTRKAMQFPKIAFEIAPKLQAYSEMTKLLREKGDTKRAKKVQKQQEAYQAAMKPQTIVYSFVGSGIAMMVINRGLNHLARTTPMVEGGIGPFLDMSAMGNSTVAYYALPICIVSALATNGLFQMRDRPFFNPRLAVVAVPAAGVLVYLTSYLSVTLALHYAISSWVLTSLALASSNERLRKLLGLPEPMKAPNMLEAPKLGLTTPLQPVADPPVEAISHLPFDDNQYDKSEEQIIQEITTTRRRRMYEQNLDTYTPFFKIGPYAEEPKEDKPEVRRSELPDNCADLTKASSGGLVKTMEKFAGNFKMYPVKRIKAWFYRYKLMRHAKKGKMTEFLSDAPPEQNFLREPVQLTTKVTPGLKRYVERRQYPYDTLEQVKRKVSYIERVQSQRW